MKIFPAAAREYIKLAVLVRHIVPTQANQAATPRNSGLGHTRCRQPERAASDEQGVTLTRDEAFTSSTIRANGLASSRPEIFASQLQILTPLAIIPFENAFWPDYPLERLMSWRWIW